jgi:hypothetical protein
MQMKQELKELQNLANRCLNDVANVIRILTADNPLILFDKDTIESDNDTLYDLPFGYYVGKYEYYNEGTIWKVHGNDVTIMLRGEQFGDTWELSVSDLPFESQVDLLTYLAERIEE